MKVGGGLVELIELIELIESFKFKLFNYLWKLKFVISYQSRSPARPIGIKSFHIKLLGPLLDGP
jgi:hypothetical protein